MVTASFLSRLSQAIDQIEERRKQSHPLKVVKVRCGFDEDRDVARDRHYAAHPEDRGAHVVIFKFYDEDMPMGTSHVCGGDGELACKACAQNRGQS